MICDFYVLIYYINVWSRKATFFLEFHHWRQKSRRWNVSCFDVTVHITFSIKTLQLIYKRGKWICQKFMLFYPDSRTFCRCYQLDSNFGSDFIFIILLLVNSSSLYWDNWDGFVTAKIQNNYLIWKKYFRLSFVSTKSKCEVKSSTVLPDFLQLLFIYRHINHFFGIFYKKANFIE